MPALTTTLSTLLQAPTVWSVNGANAVSQDNPYGFGYISFGGNDEAMKLWRGLTPDDCVITLGFDAGEYSLNLASIPAGRVWHFTGWTEPYGHIGGDFRHRVGGDYRLIRGDLDAVLQEIIPRLKRGGVGRRPPLELPARLNTRPISRDVRDGCVDFMAFYEALHASWRPNSIGFDDVCIAYKDRQYVTQRPHPFIPFHTMHDGSAMGGGFGLGIGGQARQPQPAHVRVLQAMAAGGSSAARSRRRRTSICASSSSTTASTASSTKGLEVVIPEVERRRYHASLPSIDFVAAARAHGWDGYHVKPDLSNLRRHHGGLLHAERPIDAWSMCRSTPTRSSASTRG